MGRNIKGLFSAIVLTVLLSAASPALAQSVGSMSFWGDSSTDNGNIITLLIETIPGFGTAADLAGTTNGRMSNGPIWSDYVSSAFGWESQASLLGGNDYAFSGALMGQGEALVTELPFEFYVPNVGTVIDEYTAQGGVFASDEVVFLYAGHNNSLKMGSTGAMDDPEDVARDLKANLEKLYNSGARQIVAPTLVALEYAPAIMAYPNGTELMGSWIAAYQAEAAKVVAAFMAEHPDAVVIVPDIGALTRKIIADPGKYGFTNITDAGSDETTGQAKPGSDNYLWWDVHVTTKAQRLFAQEMLGAMGDYYYPKQMLPQAAAASMQLNRVLAQEAMKRASLRLRQAKPYAEGQGSNHLYATPYYGWGSQSGQALATGFDWKAYGTDVGFQRRLSPVFTAGLNLDIHEADADCESGGGEAKVKGMGVMPYAGFAKDNWRAHTGARYGRDDNSADRPLSMTDTTARAGYNTDSWAAWGEVGRDFGLADGLTLTPLANVSWARVNGVDTEESGADLLNSYLELDDYNSLRHLLGATLAATVDMGLDRDISLQFTAGWRHEYLDTRTQSSAELAGTTRTLDGPDSDHDALSAELQISCPLPGGAALELAYTGDFSQNTDGQSLLLWIKASF